MSSTPPAQASSSESDIPTLVADGEGEPDLQQLGSALAETAFAERYQRERRLGEGGVGVVHLSRDKHVGRSVAMKVLRPEHAHQLHLRARFVREARVQGQLEHPAIVPVYDLGLAPDGNPYFTMKRVRGVTLAAVLAKLIAGDADTRTHYSRRRLLGVFARVCLAVDYAHQHGVIHRDLKPENIMLGDWGEVYVLDWGLAKVGAPAEVQPLNGVPGQQPAAAGAARPPAPATASTDRTVSVPARVQVGDSAVEVGLDEGLLPAAFTQAGAVMGTPGFMCPEQILGNVGPPAPAWDVYALGAVLFELLTLLPLHPPTPSDAAFASTLQGVEARPSVRAPDLQPPPELDGICVRACALDPVNRYASARELHDRIEAYLGGERDAELRAELARAHAERAEAAVRQAFADAGAEIEARRRAMKELGRALALDPDHQRAREALVHLLSEPPKAVPAEVYEQMRRASEDKTRWIARFASVAYASLVVYMPFFLWLGVRNPNTLVLFIVAAMAVVALAAIASKQRHPSQLVVVVAMVISQVAFALTAGMFGAFVMTPALIAVNTTAFALYVRRANRAAVIAIGCVSLLVPMALEIAGVTSSYRFSDAGMTIVPVAVELPRMPVLLFLALVGITTILTSCLSTARMRDALERAERRLYVYTWHLRELVPRGSRVPDLEGDSPG